jgi:hypothetical protein
MPTRDLIQQTNSFIQRENEIVQRSHSIISDYERGKADAEALLKRGIGAAEATRKRDKEAAEAAWKRERDTTESAWYSARTDRNLLLIREAMNSAQKVLNKSKWQHRLVGGTSRPPVIPPDSSFVQQMAVYQSVAEQATKQINSLLGEYGSRASQRFMAGTWGFFIGFTVFIVAGLIEFLSNIANQGFILVLISFSAFVLTAVLIYTIRTRSMLSKLRGSYATILQAVSLAEVLHNDQLPRLQERYQRQIDESQTRYQVSTEQIEQTYQHQLTEYQTRYRESVKQLDETLQRKLAELKLELMRLTHEVGTFTQEAGVLGARWDDPIWKQWQPIQTATPITRPGTVTFRSPQEELPPLMLFVACPGGENILFKATDTAKNTAIGAIQSFMLRLLATQPPGQVRFTLIDPVALGQNFAAFMQLADYDEALVTSRAWIQPGHIQQQLDDLTEHMGDVIRRYLRGQYSTLEEYKRAGGVAEPYRILVVMDFPVNFTVDTARRLVNIATNGPRCGVSTIVMVDTQQPMPPGFKLADLERVSTVIAWDGQKFVWRESDEQTVFTH